MTDNWELDSADADSARLAAGLFALLIKGHTELSHRASLSSTLPLTSRFRYMLNAFAQAYASTQVEELNRSTSNAERFKRLFAFFADAHERRRARQAETADEFNLLNVLRLTGNEVRHSMVLAWLLDHDLDRLGSHAQGPLGFRLFLQEFKLPGHYANARYWVRREVAGDESIVDIEVAARGQFLIHIENKIWSSEGSDQTNREWADVQRRAFNLGIDLGLPEPPIRALFLTPDGAMPRNQHFKPITWGRVVRVLERFSEQAKPPDVKLFAAHYAKAITTFVAARATDHGVEDGQTNVE